MSSTENTGSGTGAAPEGHAAGRGSASTAVFRAAMRGVLTLLGVLVVVGTAAGWFISGVPGAWGALIGVAITLVFSGTTIAAMLVTADSDVTRTALVVMGSWLGKMLVVIVVLAVLRGYSFYDRSILAIVLSVGVVGSALVDFRAVQRGRVPYVETSSRTDPQRPGDGQQ